MNKQVEWAKQIGAIAKTGLFYDQDPFDKDRFQRLVDIASEILAGYRRRGRCGFQMRINARRRLYHTQG